MSGQGIAVVPAVRAQHPAPRQAPSENVALEVLLLHGTNNGTGIDPRLGKIPALGKPPFSAFNSYELLRREIINTGVIRSPDVRYYPVSIDRFIREILDQEFRE